MRLQINPAFRAFAWICALLGRLRSSGPKPGRALPIDWEAPIPNEEEPRRSIMDEISEWRKPGQSIYYLGRKMFVTAGGDPFGGHYFPPRLCADYVDDIGCIHRHTFTIGEVMTLMESNHDTVDENGLEGASLINAERQRQVLEAGWTQAHDLERANRRYEAYARTAGGPGFDRVQMLAAAGAIIAAKIDQELRSRRANAGGA